MKAYYIFQQADEETISNILDWMRNQERAIYRAAVRELGALKKLRPEFIQRKPLQEHGGTNAAILTTKIVIESNPVLKKSDATAVLGWDADDLADLLAIGLEGHREFNWLPSMKLKVTSTESSRVQMTNKAVTITVEQTAILKHGN